MEHIYGGVSGVLWIYSWWHDILTVQAGTHHAYDDQRNRIRRDHHQPQSSSNMPPSDCGKSFSDMPIKKFKKQHHNTAVSTTATNQLIPDAMYFLRY